ncbi:GTP-binding protein EngB [Archaeoglobus veneficus]|uniref:Probable GTP-binding protein EngB n=1 Tax=Archaeoglobus veneficus (strain DSM 11195 / SNP6) TaxID=693661 RepID=F2KT15_ARCVS|nr:GTP-binding protein EngB [Archaeoglobus veneficus]AEA47045.1 GTP-binding protein HSR1-related protein [Archaeoglobus veneficus SNP6]
MDSGRVKHEIIFVGRSNVGKSTLFSALFGKKVRKGKKPGTTIKPNFLQYRDLLITDLPGYGYIRGVNRDFNERVKDFIVHYIENNANRIIVSVHVIDAKAFPEVVERWESRGEIPVDIEMYEFLDEVSNVIVAANKIDKVENVDETLDIIAEKLGMLSRDMIFPVCAKKGEVKPLKEELKKRLVRAGRSDLLGVFRR